VGSTDKGRRCFVTVVIPTPRIREYLELTYSLKKKFGISNEVHSILIRMNDGESKYKEGTFEATKIPGKSFLEIADWIEENL
jgi:hypothetical protein